MKITKLFGLLAATFTLGLASCNNQPAKPADPVLMSIAVSGEYKTEYLVGEEFDSTGIIVMASYDKGEDKDVSSEASFSGFDSSIAGPCIVTASYQEKTAEINLVINEPAKTVEGVAADIGSNLGVDLTNKDTYFIITLNFSQEGVDYSNSQAAEDVLMPVVATLYNNYMPEYLELQSASYFAAEDDFWEDESGDTAYYAFLSVDEVGVDLIGYCYNGYLLGQVVVYSIAE